MSSVVERQYKKCESCNQITVHFRYQKRVSKLVFILHIFLAILTYGFWLVVVVFCEILNINKESWKCFECGNKVRLGDER